MSADAGSVAAISRALTALQSRDSDASWVEITELMKTDWSGTSDVIVACFYVAAHKEWPSGPTRNQLSGFVRFLSESYGSILIIPQYVTDEIVESVFTGDYRVFDFVPHDTLLTLQLIITAAITGHRGLHGDKLRSFVDSVSKESSRYKRTG